MWKPTIQPQRTAQPTEPTLPATPSAQVPPAQSWKPTSSSPAAAPAVEPERSPAAASKSVSYARLRERNQITLPAAVVERMGLRLGDVIEFSVSSRGVVQLHSAKIVKVGSPEAAQEVAAAKEEIEQGRYTVIRNLNEFRQEVEKARRGEVEEDDEKFTESQPAAAEVGGLSAVLNETLEGLPPRFRSVLMLHYVEGRSKEETANTLGLSVAAVESILRRARLYLRSQVERHLQQSAPNVATAKNDSAEMEASRGSLRELLEEPISFAHAEDLVRSLPQEDRHLTPTQMKDVESVVENVVSRVLGEKRMISQHGEDVLDR